MTSRRTFLQTALAGATAGIASLAGCGGGGGTRSYDLAGGPDTTAVSIDMTGQNTFDPAVVQVDVGATITWHNRVGAHSTTAYHPENGKPRRIPTDASPWDSGVLTNQGATFEHTFEVPGVYDYYCTPHESLGMVGSIVVGTPTLDGQPGLTEPQDALPDQAAQKLRAMNEAVRTKLE